MQLFFRNIFRNAIGVVLVSLLLTVNVFNNLFNVSIINFEQVITGLEGVWSVLNEVLFKCTKRLKVLDIQTLKCLKNLELKFLKTLINQVHSCPSVLNSCDTWNT